METLRNQSISWRSFTGVFLVTCMAGIASGQQPGKRRVDTRPPSPNKARATEPSERGGDRGRPQKAYVRTQRDYGHVRVAEPRRNDDGRLNVRPIIVRSTRVTPNVLTQFDERHRAQVSVVIRNLREGQRDTAMGSWRSFVQSLSECDRPIDLDEVMLYVGREGCLHQSGALLFHGARLDQFRESADLLRDYLDELQKQREDCASGRSACTVDTVKSLDIALVRARADLRILGIEMDVADDEMEAIIAAEHEYEQRFARTYEDMYREAELVIGWRR